MIYWENKLIIDCYKYKDSCCHAPQDAWILIEKEFKESILYVFSIILRTFMILKNINIFLNGLSLSPFLYY